MHLPPRTSYFKTKTQIIQIIIQCTLNSWILFWLANSSIHYIFKISACDVITADYTIIMSRTQARSWVIMSIVCAHCVTFRHWRSKNMTSFFSIQCIIKQLLDSVFVTSRIIKVLPVRVISLSLQLRMITLSSTLIILDITKTSSSKCWIHTTSNFLCTPKNMVWTIKYQARR